MTSAVRAVRDDLDDEIHDLVILLLERVPDYGRITNALIHLRHLALVAEREGIVPSDWELRIDRLSGQLRTPCLNRRVAVKELSLLSWDIPAGAETPTPARPSAT